MLIGYARVSTEDQNLDLQRDALKAAGRSRIFEEKESGRAGTKRPALEGALDFLRTEDQLVWSGRSTVSAAPSAKCSTLRTCCRSAA